MLRKGLLTKNKKGNGRVVMLSATILVSFIDRILHNSFKM